MANPRFNLRHEESPANTSSADFIRSLREFLDRNQIDFVGPFRMQVEQAGNNKGTILVSGETGRSVLNPLDQVGAGSAWPCLPTPPDDHAAQEWPGSRPTNSTPSGPSSVTFPEGDMDIDSCYSRDGLLQFPPSSFTDEATSLSSSLLDYTDPSAVETQGSPTMTSLADYMGLCLPTNSNEYGPPNLDFSGEIGTPPASRRIGAATHRNVPSISRRRETTSRRDAKPRRRKTGKESSDSLGDLIVQCLSRNVLCEDFYTLLESELPRWTREGLRNDTLQMTSDPNSPSSPGSPRSKLEMAYLAVCQLNSRMSDDLVRNRMALIRLHLEYTETHKARQHHAAGAGRASSTVGRGDASHVIDGILRNIHEGWEALDTARRAKLRAKFHDRKRYGKRWAQVADAFGHGILLICSSKLANAVRSTAVTAKMLEDIIATVEALHPDTLKIIGVVSPLAGCLLKNEGFNQFRAPEILRQLRCCCSKKLTGEDGVTSAPMADGSEV